VRVLRRAPKTGAIGERQAALLDAHQRLVAGDPSAAATVFREVHRWLVHLLVRLFGTGGLPEDIAEDLATDALVEYITHPTRFEPSRSKLSTYLALIAKRDAMNWLEKDRRTQRAHDKLVEIDAAGGNIEEERYSVRIDAEMVLRKFGGQIVTDVKDSAVLCLMLKGEDSTDVYAAAIGVAHLSLEERRAAVKKRRDKIERRLERLGDKL